MKHGVLVKYRDFLPVTPNTPLFSLGEGDTPLVRCGELDKEIDNLVYDLYELTEEERKIVEGG